MTFEMYFANPPIFLPSLVPSYPLRAPLPLSITFVLLPCSLTANPASCFDVAFYHRQSGCHLLGKGSFLG